MVEREEHAEDDGRQPASGNPVVRSGGEAERKGSNRDLGMRRDTCIHLIGLIIPAELFRMATAGDCTALTECASLHLPRAPRPESREHSNLPAPPHPILG